MILVMMLMRHRKQEVFMLIQKALSAKELRGILAELRRKEIKIIKNSGLTLPYNKD